MGLDPVLRQDPWQRFHALADVGTTLFVSSRAMDEADRCDRLAVAARRQARRRRHPGQPQTGHRRRQPGAGIPASAAEHAAELGGSAAADGNGRSGFLTSVRMTFGVAGRVLTRIRHDRPHAGGTEPAARVAVFRALRPDFVLYDRPGLFDRIGLICSSFFPTYPCSWHQCGDAAGTGQRDAGAIAEHRVAQARPAMPLRYAAVALSEAGGHSLPTGAMWLDLSVVVGCVLLALLLGCWVRPRSGGRPRRDQKGGTGKGGRKGGAGKRRGTE
ncbi:hypothetical protein FDG2_2212 [Candidatus Protofrankia californiensis]|uniref:Uncharacterized protein n=1 Tax=Candidatus Protofrankia californiensis TaxID=1839754 RepID=A0A1C3NX96_9ACTN|nr:hypothetical protein FDG2_2212 [Candidatus Protofrankia californiensis]